MGRRDGAKLPAALRKGMLVWLEDKQSLQNHACRFAALLGSVPRGISVQDLCRGECRHPCRCSGGFGEERKVEFKSFSAKQEGKGAD